MYNRHGKSANESRKYRQSGETYQLALKMLQEKKEKLAAQAAGGKIPFYFADIALPLFTSPQARLKRDGGTCVSTTTSLRIAQGCRKKDGP